MFQVEKMEGWTVRRGFDRDDYGVLATEFFNKIPKAPIATC